MTPQTTYVPYGSIWAVLPATGRDAEDRDAAERADRADCEAWAAEAADSEPPPAKGHHMAHTLTLTIADLRAHRACDLDARVADLTAHLGRRPDDDEPIPLATWWALPSTSIEDQWWSLRAAAPSQAARVLGVRAACLAARRVLHFFETRSPDDPRPRVAVEAAEAWAVDPTPVRAEACRVAAAAAYAANASAADVAAYAASAAGGAASAAGGAASSAAYAAAYAAYAVRSYVAEREAQRADLDRLLAETENAP